MSPVPCTFLSLLRWDFSLSSGSLTFLALSLPAVIPEPVPTAEASCPVSERDPYYLFFVLAGIFGVSYLSLSPSPQPAFFILEGED